MKTKSILIAVMLFALTSVNVFAQDNETVVSTAKEIIKAYHERNPDLLKEHASGMLKPAISKSFFEDEKLKDILGAVDNWDNKIREVRYSLEDFFGKKVYAASVYFSDSKNEDKIWTVDLSSTDGKNWVAFALGIAETDKSDFDEMKKTLESEKSPEQKQQRLISIEMANGDKIAESTVEQAIENLDKMDEDDNFFIILNAKDGFMQASFSKKGFTVQYKEDGGKQYEAKKLLSKEKTIEMFKEYYKIGGRWKELTEWEEM